MQYATSTYTSPKSFASGMGGTSEGAGERALKEGLAGGEAMPVLGPPAFFCCLFFSCIAWLHVVNIIQVVIFTTTYHSFRSRCLGCAVTIFRHCCRTLLSSLFSDARLRMDIVSWSKGTSVQDGQEQTWQVLASGVGISDHVLNELHTSAAPYIIISSRSESTFALYIHEGVAGWRKRKMGSSVTTHRRIANKYIYQREILGPCLRFKEGLMMSCND
jgi:hypothetical protein